MTDNKDQTPYVCPVGSPCWIEINATDPHKLKEFYAALFPTWTFRAVDSAADAQTIHYSFEQPLGLTGGIVKLPADCPKPQEQSMGIGSTVYYFVNSIDEIDPLIVKHGGSKVLGKKEESQHGYYANFKDPEGNRFGVYETRFN